MRKQIKRKQWFELRKSTLPPSAAGRGISYYIDELRIIIIIIIMYSFYLFFIFFRRRCTTISINGYNT